MGWTYHGDPSLSTRDAARFLIGDTDSTWQLVSDEEIDFVLASQSNQYLAAAELCEAIAAKFAREVSTSNAGLSVGADQRSRAYAERAAALKKKARRFATIYAGGLDISEKQYDDADTGKVQPAFKRGMDDNKSA